MFISSFISSSPKLERTQSPSTGRTAEARNGDELQKHCRQGTTIVIQSRSVVAYGQGWGWGIDQLQRGKGSLCLRGVTESSVSYHTTVYNCQNSSNWVTPQNSLEMGEF